MTTSIEHVFGGTLRSTRSVSVQSSPTSVQLALGAASAIVLTNTGLSGAPITVTLPPEAQSAGSQICLQCGGGSTGPLIVQGGAGPIQSLPAGLTGLYACDGNAWYALGTLEPQGALLGHTVELEPGESVSSVVVSSGRVSATGAILVTPEGGADIAITSWPSILMRSPGESVTIKIEAENTGMTPAILALNLMIS